MNSKIVIGIIIVAVLAGVGYWIWNNQNTGNQQQAASIEQQTGRVAAPADLDQDLNKVDVGAGVEADFSSVDGDVNKL